MVEKILSVFTALALCTSLAACGGGAASSGTASEAPAATEAPAEETPAQAASEESVPEAEDVASYLNFFRVAGLKGPTTMGMVNMLETGQYDFTMYGAADEIVPLLVKGELDAAAIPANLAATLYQKTEGAVQVACINTLGVLYMVELGQNIQSVEDLRGATIVTTGKGTTPEYVLRYVLQGNGIDPDADVTIEYLSEATEVAARLTELSADSRAVVAMLPQPFVTSVVAQSEGGVRVALDMTEEWQKVAGSRLVTGVLVVRKDVLETEEGEAAFAQFMKDYEASTIAANTDVEGTAALCEEYGIVAKAALAQKALPQCNIVFETGSEMKTDLGNYLQVLFDADPSSVGGILPADDFYYAG